MGEATVQGGSERADGATRRGAVCYRPRGLLLGVVGLLVVAGCNVPLLADLDETRAARVVVALDKEQIGARKAADPAHEDRYVISVAADDVAGALQTLQEAGLPGIVAPGVLDALGEPGMVPTQAGERARLLVGLAGELEASLLAVDGVLSARIHIAAPPERALAARSAVTPSASVLLRHSGVTPPLSELDLKRLVAGAVSGLTDDRVSVVMHPVPSPPRTPSAPRLVALGPFSVARSSLVLLRLTLAAAAVLNLVLAVLLWSLWTRYRAQRQAPPSSQPQGRVR